MEASQSKGAPPGKCRDWRAFQGPGVIVVDGWCTFPKSGYKVEMRKAEPQGINPKDLLLERVVTEPEGYQPAIVRAFEIHWEEQTDIEYSTVTIIPDGPTIDVVDAREPPPRPEL